MFFDRLCLIISSFAGSGYFPVAPATFGTFIAALLMWWAPAPATALYVIITIVLFFIGMGTSHRVEQRLGPDPSAVVIDEIVGFLIAMFGFTWSFEWLIGGFFLFRLFDIVKPFPANRSQKLPGGLGIMTDDVIAGVYSNLVLRIIRAL
jgi:phosphatidylglycerophosphatase A